MQTMDEAEAWGAYWAQMGEAGGCLPGAPEAVARALGQLWVNFAAALGKDAHLLDLACGTGAVLREIRQARPDLRLTGVDLAELPAGSDAGIELIGEADIGALPLADDSCDAVTSQFGIEYADHGRAIAEAGRVARPGARLQFVLHHRDSPILGQNRRRLGAIRSCQQTGIAGKVGAGRTSGAIIAQTLQPIARAFPGQLVINEIGAALAASQRLGDQARREEAARIETGMDREITMLAALDKVAMDGPAIEGFAKALAAGWIVEPPEPIITPVGNAPLGWLVRARAAD